MGLIEKIIFFANNYTYPGVGGKISLEKASKIAPNRFVFYNMFLDGKKVYI